MSTPSAQSDGSGVAEREPVTVAVLTYNSGATIDACLASIAAQTVAPAEVVVVDDHSTDDTLARVGRADLGAVPVRVVANGSHNISRGRNLAIDAATAPIVAFCDSDAYADPGWVAALAGAFAAPGRPAAVGGEVVAASATRFAEALAVNDTAVRDLFARGSLLVSGCNMAVHRERIGGARFDEAWVHAEDIEFVHRACPDRWAVAPAAVVHHESRATPRGYLRQMYRYGAWKVRYSLRTRDVRPVDYVPTAVLAASLLAAPFALWALLAFPALCVAETAFVAAYRRPRPRLVGPMLAGWVVKNVGWGLGVVRGALTPSPARASTTMPSPAAAERAGV